VCSKCNHEQCMKCPPEGSREAIAKVGLLDSLLRPRAPTAMLNGEFRNTAALENPMDNDGPSRSLQSRRTGQVGSSTSGTSLQTPDSAILREGRDTAYAPRWRLSTSDKEVVVHANSVPAQSLQPYILFCVPTPAVLPHGAYLSHICRKRFTGHDFFTRLNAEFDRLRASTRCSKFWARFRVIGCQEIKLVRVSVPEYLDGERVS
jgi:hypothetical protein